MEIPVQKMMDIKEVLNKHKARSEQLKAKVAKVAPVMNQVYDQAESQMDAMDKECMELQAFLAQFSNGGPPLDE